MYHLFFPAIFMEMKACMHNQVQKLLQRMAALPEAQQQLFAALFLQQIEQTPAPEYEATEALEALVAAARLEQHAAIDMERMFDEIKGESELL